MEDAVVKVSESKSSQLLKGGPNLEDSEWKLLFIVPPSTLPLWWCPLDSCCLRSFLSLLAWRSRLHLATRATTTIKLTKAIVIVIAPIVATAPVVRPVVLEEIAPGAAAFNAAAPTPSAKWKIQRNGHYPERRHRKYNVHSQSVTNLQLGQ